MPEWDSVFAIEMINRFISSKQTSLQTESERAKKTYAYNIIYAFQVCVVDFESFAHHNLSKIKFETEPEI